MFGIAFILYFIGRIFLLSDINVAFKRIVVAIPFTVMLLNVMSWYVTRFFPSFAYAAAIAGALMGLSMSMQILISPYQMWFHRSHPVRTSDSMAKREYKCRELLNEFGYAPKNDTAGWNISTPTGRQDTVSFIKDVENYVRCIELHYQQTD